MPELYEYTMSFKVIEWIEANRKLVTSVAKAIMHLGKSHHYAFNRNSKLMTFIVDVAFDDLRPYSYQTDLVDGEVRSYIANYIHDRQWIHERVNMRSHGAFQ